MKKSLCTMIILAYMLCMSGSVYAQTKHTRQRYQVACCDWMMLKRQKLGAFKRAQEVHADGVEIDMGPLGKRVQFENQLRNATTAQAFKHMADSLHIQVCSIAMSGFFAQNFITRTNYKDLIADCLNTMAVFQCKVAFLPLGGSGHEWETPGAQRDTLISRLRIVGKMARKRGCVIGIRTGLNAKASIELLKEVNSKGIKIYYNFQDAADAGRDIAKELRLLGKKRICQIHASNTDGVNLKDDAEIDLPAIKQALDNMKWKGWLVVERSRDAKKVRDVVYNFRNNVDYLKNIFNR